MRTNKHSLHHRKLPPVVSQQFKLEAWHRYALYGMVAALFASGLAWLLAHFFLRVAGEFGESNHPLEHWSMQLHGALILPLSFLAGGLLFQHMRRAHRAGRNRNSGWSMIALLLWLALTGYALYYFASETLRPYWSLVHWVAGCALPLLLWLHIRLGRRHS
ncbi:DUF4405 domain-containing protein [Undibacterium sp. TS12]|uniref:DUF4405 domain-containing protein n=1 Tax=Undibacterium sp. TS12 TaxID=2908202 RepID=UPI001F4D08BE|nr:DUF4405 domain-containing protein [Undibacterium sp. TS12]MCH8619577.1 DUF4405 domain-containing protein [Undibacterium sp. TS12]